jgi:hypothetical protein
MYHDFLFFFATRGERGWCAVLRLSKVCNWMHTRACGDPTPLCNIYLLAICIFWDGAVRITYIVRFIYVSALLACSECEKRGSTSEVSFLLGRVYLSNAAVLPVGVCEDMHMRRLFRDEAEILMSK